MADEVEKNAEHPAPPPCPTCNKPVEPDATAFPFCSSRCKMVDLNRWLSGDYTISRPLEQKDIEDGE